MDPTCSSGHTGSFDPSRPKRRAAHRDGPRLNQFAQPLDPDGVVGEPYCDGTLPTLGEIMSEQLLVIDEAAEVAGVIEAEYTDNY